MNFPSIETVKKMFQRSPTSEELNRIKNRLSEVNNMEEKIDILLNDFYKGFIDEFGNHLKFLSPLQIDIYLFNDKYLKFINNKIPNRKPITIRGFLLRDKIFVHVQKILGSDVRIAATFGLAAPAVLSEDKKVKYGEEMRLWLLDDELTKEIEDSIKEIKCELMALKTVLHKLDEIGINIDSILPLICRRFGLNYEKAGWQNRNFYGKQYVRKILPNLPENEKKVLESFRTDEILSLADEELMIDIIFKAYEDAGIKDFDLGVLSQKFNISFNTLNTYWEKRSIKEFIKRPSEEDHSHYFYESELADLQKYISVKKAPHITEQFFEQYTNIQSPEIPKDGFSPKFFTSFTLEPNTSKEVKKTDLSTNYVSELQNPYKSDINQENSQNFDVDKFFKF